MILLDADTLAARRALVSGPLRGLADSLRADLARVLERPLFIPEQKARLSRGGGRCPADGESLEFDPFEPRRHRCPTCGTVYEDEAHYRWWIMGYQLWLAERTVHAAVLHMLRGDVEGANFAREVFARYAELYEMYPNVDNVLGPGRPFFSTYLESIWTLQLCVAASALDVTDGPSPETDQLRDRVIAPSARCIRSYDEGASNRQVWNAAALAAAGRLLEDRQLLDAGLFGGSGISVLLEHGLLSDGSWYEGENYHLFAHRGLWYGVALARAAGRDISDELVARFDEGSAIPFLTALPDLTFPARRDSQYAVSLRQWRFAELAELGVARAPDDRRLTGALFELYHGNVPRGETGRWRSTAEAERNMPASALTRDDLGWRSLLFARGELPPLAPEPRTSALLPAQGLAILRRDEGRVYVGFDYGHSGGGHGHPDRLNLLLADGPTRWLDDMGTGSYVDPTLHWYRSTLAHNAPVPNGRSQLQANGTLLSWDEDGDFGWVEGRVDGAAEGIGMLRTVIVSPDYLIDRFIFWGAPDTQIDLPLHVDGEVPGARWRAGDPEGSDGPEDGYRWLTDAEVIEQRMRELVLRCHAPDGARADCFLLLPEGRANLWRAIAPGPPGKSRQPRRMHFIRARGMRGVLVSVWSWRGAVQSVAADGESILVRLTGDREHRHQRSARGWSIGLRGDSALEGIELAGQLEELAPPDEIGQPAPLDPFEIPVASDRDLERGAEIPALEFELEGQHYRRSETGWRDAGSPTAIFALMSTPTQLVIETAVHKEPMVFAPRRGENDLDNEHPDINSDGVQLYLRPHDSAGPSRSVASWILVPEPDGAVRITERSSLAARIPLTARWRTAPGGWEMRCVVPVSVVAPLGRFDLDFVINEIAPGRERRRGQLVLSGGAGEYVYLRGDRQPESRLVPFQLARAKR